jgi:hypothetical protein
LTSLRGLIEEGVWEELGKFYDNEEMSLAHSVYRAIFRESQSCILATAIYVFVDLSGPFTVIAPNLMGRVDGKSTCVNS